MNRPYTSPAYGNYLLGPTLEMILIVVITIIGSSQAPAAELAPARLSFYVQKLQAKQKATRLAAIQSLGDLGSGAKAAIPHLLALITHRDVEVQRQAAGALAQIGPAAIPGLRMTLKHDRARVRFWAVESLGRMGPDANPAFADLLSAFDDPKASVRSAVLSALLAIDPKTEKLKSLLDVALHDKDAYVRLLAGLALERGKPKVRKAPSEERANPFALMPTVQLSAAQEALLDELINAIIDEELRNHVDPLFSTNAFTKSYMALVLYGGDETIPALVRGVNKCYALQASCPLKSLSKYLHWKVEHCTDPGLLDYGLVHLGRGILIPRPLPINVSHLAGCRQAFLRRKAELAPLILAAAKRQAEFNRLVARLLDLNDTTLLARLTDGDPDTRLAAVVAVARRRLHAEEPLFDRLDDTDPRVVQAARQTLALLARGTDFGPPAKAKRAARRLAQKRWRAWWSWQDSNPKARKFPPVELPPPVPLAQQMADTLVKAPAARKPALLARLRKGVGVEYTEALADAASRLDEPFRAQAREVLAARLRRVTPRQLRDMLKGQDAELRRAAAQACGARADREFVPDLIGPLADPDREVSAAARAALRTLTGEDFGPADKASLKQREAAAKKWRAWWAKQEGR